MKKISGTLLMVVLALICMVFHFYFGWGAFVDEARAHNETAEMDSYLIQWARDTFENLQSEFWQLAAQFLLLAGLLRFMGIEAYEADQEEIKERLDKIEKVVVQ